MDKDFSHFLQSQISQKVILLAVTKIVPSAFLFRSALGAKI